MTKLSRRKFVNNTALGIAGAGLGLTKSLFAQDAGERPEGKCSGITVLNPGTRIPLSFIIDDSTCLVNLAYYGIPQFAEVFPERYKQQWRKLPREIPDIFVRKFGEWCGEKGIKGKYSIVPYPACVGWVDRFLPGWTEKELSSSLDLVRTLLTPCWDIHPEMISHTRIIDTKTGRPFEEASARYMENWDWTIGRSVDELADYMSYALRILKNCGLPCEGITTPGGFAHQVLPELSQATFQSCRDVFQAEIPHYFRHLFTDERSVAPRVEYASGLNGVNPECVVSIIGCTGDWFGGWDGLSPGSVDRLITEDLQGGRLPEVIRSGEPAVMVCHWPGIYYNGEEVGFNIFKEAVRRVHSGFDNLIWMKLSEISRYWAAKELTSISLSGDTVDFKAPFASPMFTVEIAGSNVSTPGFKTGGRSIPLKKVNDPLKLKSMCWLQNTESIIVCIDLPKGVSQIMLTG